MLHSQFHYLFMVCPKYPCHSWTLIQTWVLSPMSSFKVWWDFSADLTLKFGPCLLCLDKTYQWWMQLSLTLSKVIFSCLPVLATCTFSLWALQNFPCSAACQLWSLISSGVARWFGAEHRFKKVSEDAAWKCVFFFLIFYFFLTLIIALC